MTRILAIETSTDACSVALMDNDLTITECFELCPQQHTRKLLSQIEQVCREQGVILSQIDAIAFGQGPGSFTGIRIGLTVAQALGFGLQKPLLPISTLRAIAQAAYEEKGYPRVAALLDARLQSVYWGLYQVNADGIMDATQPEAVGPEDSIVLPTKDWVAVMGQYPHARVIAQLGAYDFLHHRAVDATMAIPQYVRDKVV